jgi:excisionase family DNA binding protein
VYLTLRETGERLGRGRLAVMRLISTGELKATRQGPYQRSPYRIDENDLADFLRRYPAYAEAAAQS